MTKPYGVVIISHSKDVAKGVHDIIKEIAPDVSITHAGGTEDGRIGTSFDAVNEALKVTKLIKSTLSMTSEAPK
ncbi:phosphotransferase subunit dhaM [Listeria monocytogenes N53-1]|nr:phosphotransferase subunit dhaM [Listeria monocytogenes]CCQ25396.1 phosphotransferase subunit dhaM [Listeria monocytogenes N53-1]